MASAVDFTRTIHGSDGNDGGNDGGGAPEAHGRTGRRAASNARAPRAVRPQRLVLAVVLAAALTAVVKVGLHEMTPGPVVAAPLRWVAVLAGLGVVALVVRGERA